jgi:hypothetical protein
MATSGLIGQTTFDVAQVIEHAVRRVGKVASTITEDQLTIARNNLSLILMSLVNRGVTLWSIEKTIVTLSLNSATYEMPVGTIDILNAMYRTITTTTPTWAVTATAWTGEFDADTRVLLFSFTPTTTQNLNLTAQVSADGVTWTTVHAIPTDTYIAEQRYWFDINPSSEQLYFRLQENVAVSLSLSDVTIATTLTERSIYRGSRDEYVNLPNKMAQGIPTQFWFDRQLEPRIWVWSIPTDDTASLVLWLQRQVQDVGALTNELSIPQRWMDAIIWNLAAKLCFELTEIDPNRTQLVLGMADKYSLEVEAEEYDNSPVYMGPNLGCYNK